MNKRTGLKFYWADVFATQALAGNPLPVVVEADSLDDATMKRVAREFNQAETTFVLEPSRAKATHRLRSFTAAGHEVFGAGHNALGAWLALAAAGSLTNGTPEVTYYQELGEHVLPVKLLFENQRLQRVVMKQSKAAFGATVSDALRVASALGLEENGVERAHFLPQVVSTGAPHLLVPVRDRQTVDRVRPDAERLLAILEQSGGQGCYVFALDPVDPAATAYARFFNPTVGIYEDSATGTAAGPLAAQLVSKGVLHDNSVVIIEQGYAMGRSSQLELHVSGGDVDLYGGGIVVAEGVLHV
jgi:PhzF family phenazine biosynthesis protein